MNEWSDKMQYRRYTTTVALVSWFRYDLALASPGHFAPIEV